MTAKPPSDSSSILSRWMGVGDANLAGNVHGGVILHMCDEVAGIAAVRHSGLRVVTAGMDRMTFRHPVLRGLARDGARHRQRRVANLDGGRRSGGVGERADPRGHPHVRRLPDDGRPRRGGPAPRRSRRWRRRRRTSCVARARPSCAATTGSRSDAVSRRPGRRTRPSRPGGAPARTRSPGPGSCTNSLKRPPSKLKRTFTTPWQGPPGPARSRNEASTFLPSSFSSTRSARQGRVALKIRAAARPSGAGRARPDRPGHRARRTSPRVRSRRARGPGASPG